MQHTEELVIISRIVMIIGFPLIVYFLRGILEEFKEVKKAVQDLDKRVTVIEVTTTKK